MYPHLISIGDFHLATYGFLVALGYLSGLLYVRAHLRHLGLSLEQFHNMVFGLFLWAILGGKIFFILVNFPYYWGHPMQILRELRYGFVFYGGFLASLAYGIYFCRKHNADAWNIADHFAPALALGHGIGRLGCFAAGCCYGAPTSLPWGVRFTHPQSLVDPALLGVPLHPTQLYEFLGNIFLFSLLHMVLVKLRDRKYMQGGVFLFYILFYALLRFVIEFFRVDDRGAFALGLSPSQWIALAAFIAALSIGIKRGNAYARRA